MLLNHSLSPDALILKCPSQLFALYPADLRINVKKERLKKNVKNAPAGKYPKTGTNPSHMISFLHLYQFSLLVEKSRRRFVSFGAARWHPHVRRTVAVRVGVCARGRHLLHGAHPYRTADGGAHNSYLALANGGGRVLQPGLLPGLTRFPQRVLR